MANTKSSPARGRRYWLFKSEPESYGFDQFERDGRTSWNGVRNYQARNLLRDEVGLGDGVLFYHSSTEPLAIVGIAKVTKAGYPDETAWDRKSEYHDPDSDPKDPAWYTVDIACVGRLQPPLLRSACQAEPMLAKMVLLQRGSRLSVQPVTADEWRTILRLGGQKESW